MKKLSLFFTTVMLWMSAANIYAVETPPPGYVSLYSLSYVNSVSYTQSDLTGTVVAGAASAQMVGPSNGWGDGDKYFDISKYDTLAIKLTFNSADVGKQVAVRIKWDLEGVSPVIITYPTDSSLLTFPTESTRSFVYKIALTKQRMGGMVFYNGASHWSFTYPGTAATNPVTIDYMAIKKVTATGVAVAALDSSLAAALPYGETTSLKAVYTPVVRDNAVTWESLNPSIAAVSASGVVTAGTTTGTATIKATSVAFPTLTATYAVNVIFLPVSSLTIADSAVSIQIGKTKTLGFSLLPTNATNDTIVWSSSDTTIAKVANGVVTAIKNGTALIKVTSVSDSTKKDSCYVTVIPYPSSYVSLYSLNYVNSVSYNQPNMAGTVVAGAASAQMVGPSNGWGDGDKYFDLAKYDTLAIKLTFDSADAGKQVAVRIKWDMEGVSPVVITYPTDSSLLTFPTEGTRSYVYKVALTKQRMGGMVFYNGASHWSFTYPGTVATKPVTIEYIAIEKVKATGVKVAALDTALAAALPFGKTTTMKAVFAPVVRDNAVVWESSNTAVATVSASGVVKAGTTEGTATIKATSVAFPTLSATYAVNAIFVPVSSLAIADSAVAIELGKTKALGFSLLPLNATNDTIVWSTSDTTIARVANGVVTAIKNGTALIKVISVSDSTKMDSCYVTVVPYPTKYISLYSLTYQNNTQVDMTGTSVVGASSALLVGPANGWGGGVQFYDVSAYDTLAIKFSYDTINAGKQGAFRIAWNTTNSPTPYVFTYPVKNSSEVTMVNDSTASFVYKIALTGKNHLDGFKFYNGEAHSSFTYTAAATKTTTVNYVAIEKVTATSVKVAAMDTIRAGALPTGATTTLKAVFAPVVKNNLVTWVSMDTNIATVDANGVVTAVAATGTVAIKATSVTFPTLFATYNVTVIPVTAIRPVLTEDPNAIVNVYSITGTVIRKSVKASEATVGLQKGIYIVGNKKVIVTK